MATTSTPFVGRAADPDALATLDEEIARCREAYVGLAVTELASFRAQLSGPAWG